MTEYKPTKSAWYFSVFLAAGFGAGAVDLIKWGVNKAIEKDFELEIIDIWCRDKSCTFTFHNTGDNGGALTAFSFDGARYEEFGTSHPIAISLAKDIKKIETASVAYIPAGAFSDLVFGNPPDTYPKNEVCLYSTKNKWCVSGKKLKKLIIKD